jgi:hypothetical protein
VNLKEYYKQFEADSESISNASANRSNMLKSDSDVSVGTRLVSKNMFSQIHADISDGEVEAYPSKIF